MISTASSLAPSTAALQPERHPSGLSTLFFTEMWERFSYYGMRALLVLFMADSVRGGMGLSDETATAIYGLYTAAVYLAALPGGWFADRVFGAQKAVWYGGIIIAVGQFTLAIPGHQTFFLGLMLVIAGTGLLKPNVSAIVGQLYPPGSTRRDAGFTIFYMGINLGAFLGPLVCGFLGERINWRYGFAPAGVGMVIGLIQYRLSRKRLGTAGLLPGNPKRLASRERWGMFLGLAAVGVLALLGLTGSLVINPVVVADYSIWAIGIVAFCYFAYVLVFVHLDRPERWRVAVILILCVASILFWLGFEQAGSSFNLFAERHTERFVGFLNKEIPATWFQSLGPIFVICLAPVFASLWVALARRRREPSLPVKFALGLFLLGGGFLVITGGAMVAAGGHKAAPFWLITTFLIHTLGELCISPVGLSSVTRLSPRRLVGQMMGAWFLATSLGNLIAGRRAGQISAHPIDQMPGQFLTMVWLPIAVGLVLLLIARPIARLSNESPTSPAPDDPPA